jgi:hypothetical protein
VTWPCDTCGGPATWLAFAAYETDTPEDGPLHPLAARVHPLVARYPNPMVRACSGHLVGRLWDDTAAPGSAREWVVRAVPA